MTKTNTKTYYSTDDEDYYHETPGGVFDALNSDGELEVGRVYFEADFQPIKARQVLDAEWILESADERGYELIGDTWGHPFAVSDDAQAELQDLLNAWAAKHVDLAGYYTIVGKSRQLEVTAEDLQDDNKAAT